MDRSGGYKCSVVSIDRLSRCRLTRSSSKASRAAFSCLRARRKTTGKRAIATIPRKITAIANILPVDVPSPPAAWKAKIAAIAIMQGIINCKNSRILVIPDVKDSFRKNAYLWLHVQTNSSSLFLVWYRNYLLARWEIRIQTRYIPVCGLCTNITVAYSVDL